MSPDTSSIEADLRNLRASALDEALLARLEACAADTWTQFTPAEIALENRLRAIAPAPLSPALMASLESVVSVVSFPSEKNIVRFPSRQSATPHHNRRWWAAAAAVAVIGAVSALMMPGDRGSGPAPIANQPAPALIHPSPVSDAFVPAGFNRDLREARDEGIIWQSNNEAHRVLKVVYMERVTLKAPDGRVYEVERPRVEYIHMPEQSD
ncbi:MAG: hypothetical protein WCS43_16585 [Verrucomicrobiota bacterium]